MGKELDLCLLTFTPYIGDTFLSCALARKIQALTSRDISVAQIGGDKIFVGHFENAELFSTSGGAVGELLEEGKHFSPEAPIQKLFFNGQFEYFYCPSIDYRAKIEDIAERALRALSSEARLYSFHYTYPHAYFARMAKQAGIEVIGYILDDSDNLKMINHRGEMVNAVIWTDEFIGQRLASQFLGCDLTIDDFYVNLEPNEIVVPNRVTLFPATRGNGLATAGHWNEDAERLRRQGYDVVATWMENDNISPVPFVAAGARLNGFESLGEMVKQITASEFIICNDSSAFHLAWYFGVPAVVKQKAGFNYEWVPEWVMNDPAYQFIPPVMMYEEEYHQRLSEAVQQIQSVVRQGRKVSRRALFQ